MPAGEDAGPRARPRRTLPELAQRLVFLRVVDGAAERGAEVGVVARRVGDEVIAPVIDDPAVRVGEAVGDVGDEFAGARLVAVDRGVVVADRAPRRFDLRAVEDAVA